MRHVYFAVAIAAVLAITVLSGWQQRAQAAAKKAPHTILSAQVGSISLTVTIADCHGAWQRRALPA